MAQIIYNITSGVPNFTASLTPTVLPNQTHTTLGVYAFNNVPSGTYTLKVVDGDGCVFIIRGIIIDLCTLEGNIICNVDEDCSLEGEIECDITTTTSTTFGCSSYLLYSDLEEGQSAQFYLHECNGDIVEQAVPTESSPMEFCLSEDPILTSPEGSGHFVNQGICLTTTTTTIAGTTTTSTTSDTTTTTTTNPIIEYYGFWYNGFAAQDATLTTDKAHVPTMDEFATLANAISSMMSAGKEMKETGTTFWDAPNTGTNSTAFNGRGGGRINNAVSSGMKAIAYYWSSDSVPIGDPSLMVLAYNLDWFMTSTTPSLHTGFSIRLLVTDPVEISGSSAAYYGNDGRRYECILIGAQWWLAEDLKETKFSTSATIPLYLDLVAFEATSDSAMAVYQ